MVTQPMILRVAAAHLAKFDIRDVELAIIQMLTSKGLWELTSFGKVVRKVKVQYLNTPKIYTLETVSGGHMTVRDQGGRVLAKVDLNKIESKQDILDAAKTLDRSIQVKRAEEENPEKEV